MHGSGGGFSNSAKERIDPWLDIFNDMGIATFKLDSFKGRGVETTVNNQKAVTGADMVVDVYKALELLSKHPRIDPNRIGLMGESKGGGVALYAYWEPFRKAIVADKVKFALHIALYGLCVDFEKPDFTGVPFLSLVGEKDDWTAAEPWTALMNKLKAKGYDSELVVYPGAYHAFDARYDAVLYKGAYSSKNCRFLFDKDGEVFETTTGLKAYEGGSEACRSKEAGVMVGKNWRAKRDARKKAKEFISRVFRLNETPVASKNKSEQ